MRTRPLARLSATLQRTRPHQDRAPGEPRRIGYAYLLPAALAFGLFALLPLLHGLYISFFEWDGLTEPTWVGFDNYTAALQDGTIRQAFEHALILIAFFSAIPILLGLLLAAMLSYTRVRGLRAFRTVLFLPQIIPMVSLAVIWRMIYIPDGGALNEGLRAIGLDVLTSSWLGGFDTALLSVGIVGAWVEFGLCMVLFLAGVQKIPSNRYDAARVDGAGPIREFLVVTLPGLRYEVAVAAVLTITGALRTFDLVYLTTRGGPGTATTVPAYYIYELAFRQGKAGAAAAVGMLLTALILIVSVVVIRFSERGER